MQILIASVGIEGPAEAFTASCGVLGDDQNRTIAAVVDVSLGKGTVELHDAAGLSLALGPLVSCTGGAGEQPEVAGLYGMAELPDVAPVAGARIGVGAHHHSGLAALFG